MSNYKNIKEFIDPLQTALHDGRFSRPYRFVYIDSPAKSVSGEVMCLMIIHINFLHWLFYASLGNILCARIFYFVNLVSVQI